MKCHLCGGDVPKFTSVLWCNDCIDEFLGRKTKETMDEFIERKRREASA